MLINTKKLCIELDNHLYRFQQCCLHSHLIIRLVCVTIWERKTDPQIFILNIFLIVLNQHIDFTHSFSFTLV